MGNYFSCTLSIAQGNHSRGIKVILPDNSTRQLNEPANPVEHMLDAPAYFLVNSHSMQVGQRLSPLSADEKLEMGNVYLIFQMARVNEVVAASDVGRFLMAADNVVRRPSLGRARVLPEPAGHWKERPVPRLNLEEIGDGSVVAFKQRLSM